MQHLTLAEHDALPLLLQHTCLNQDPRSICSLLCVCKSIQSSIAQQCRGLLPMAYSTQSLERVALFADWLRHWAGLASTLELEWNRISLQDVEAHLRDALQAAAAAPGWDAAGPAAAARGEGVDICTGPLQINALKANVAGPLLLGQLPSKTLTCLELGHVVDYAGV